MLRVLTLSTLFPDASRPNFGIFVERQTRGLADLPDVDLRVVAPVGLPPWPLSRLGRYRALAGLPRHETWKGLDVARPRFLNIPGTGGRFHVAMLRHALLPLLTRIRREFAFDVIDAEFFFPDGPAAVALGRHFGVPVSIKARGSDIHLWGSSPGVARQIRAAGMAAQGMLAVSGRMRDDMIALGLPGERILLSHTGVDLARFAPADRDAAKAELGIAGPLVLSVGALVPRKAHGLVIDAVAALPGVTLWIVGEGAERPALAGKIARSGAGDRIRLLGAVPHDRIPRLLAAADVMALGSQSEGLANVWVEALASGAPVVSGDIGGIREVLRDATAGRIVARTPKAFAGAIADLLAHPPDPLAVRAAALPFTWDANALTVYKHLKNLVSAR